jgi:hypothetical protein
VHDVAAAALLRQRVARGEADYLKHKGCRHLVTLGARCAND